MHEIDVDMIGLEPLQALLDRGEDARAAAVSTVRHFVISDAEFSRYDAYGMLSGAFHAGMRFEESDWRSKAGNLGSLNLFRTLFGPEHFQRNLAAVEELRPLAAKCGKSLPQFALRWTLSPPVVGTALVGF